MTKQEKELNNFFKDHLNLDEIIKNYSQDDYFDWILNVEDKLKENYNNKNHILKNVILGNHEIIIKDKGLSIGNYFTYLILILPFRKYRKEFNYENFFIDVTNIGNLDNYFNKIIQYFTINEKIDISEDIKDILDTLSIFSCEAYLISSGSSISLYDMIELAERNKDVKEAINFKLPDDAIIDPQELADQQEKNLKKFIKAIDSDKDNNFKTFLESGAGINKNQFNECFCYIGFKPDYFGKVIPTPINTSFSRGLNVKEFFINATGARKALAMSKGQVRSSGYLNRKLGLLLADMRLERPEEDYDCGTKHTMQIFIKDKNTLERFNNRYIVEDNGKLRLIHNTDTDLIGTTIHLRSPITCACENERVCSTCYGKMSRVNKNRNIGTIAELILTNPLKYIEAIFIRILKTPLIAGNS